MLCCKNPWHPSKRSSLLQQRSRERYNQTKKHVSGAKLTSPDHIRLGSTTPRNLDRPTRFGPPTPPNIQHRSSASTNAALRVLGKPSHPDDGLARRFGYGIARHHGGLPMGIPPDLARGSDGRTKDQLDSMCGRRLNHPPPTHVTCDQHILTRTSAASGR